jgi:hypothetical protein
MKIKDLMDMALAAIEKEDVGAAVDLIPVLRKNKIKFQQQGEVDNIIGTLEIMCKGYSSIRKGDNDDGLILYDFSKFDNHKSNWYDLWDTDKYETFSEFFYRFIIPTFHKVPNADIQHPIMACFALFNSATIPNDSQKPNGICCGQSRTGKSKFAERIMNLLPKPNTCTIKGNSSPKAITEAIHNVCYVSGDESQLVVKPSAVKFDNIYWDSFIDRLDIHYVTLLALEKLDAICEIAGKDGGKYHTFSKYVFTTVEQPVRDNPKMDELLNRSFCFYFEKGYAPDIEPSLYRWDGFSNEYLKIWNKQDVENRFFKILSECAKLQMEDTVMSLQMLDISRLLIATGLYCNIFSSLQEAVEAFEAYWQFVLLKQDNVGNMLFKLVNNYLQKYYYADVNFQKQILKERANLDIRISFKHLGDEIEHISNGIIRLNQKTSKEIEDIMSQHDLILFQNVSVMEFVKREYLVR